LQYDIQCLILYSTLMEYQLEVKYRHGLLFLFQNAYLTSFFFVLSQDEFPLHFWRIFMEGLSRHMAALL
jgi:hypothetical protein